MQRILFGDNQFFGVNHISDEKSRTQLIKFKNDSAILKTLDDAMSCGLNTFMCTTHERIARICDVVRDNPIKYNEFKFFPCMPYAHKYANAATELGVFGAIKQYVPGSIVGSMLKGGVAYLKKDYISMIELLIDSEMKAFKGVNTPIIFLQNIVTDLLIGLGMSSVLAHFSDYIRRKYNAEAGFITMNMPRLLNMLQNEGLKNPIICFSFNSKGFRMSGGLELYRQVLAENEFQAIAMQIFGGGAINPQEAVRFVCESPNIKSILFGASTKNNIEQTVSMIKYFDKQEIIQTC